MKNLLSLAFLLLAFGQVLGQVPDTISPENRVRAKIAKFQHANTQSLNSPEFKDTFNSLIDIAASRTPFLTQKELRRGKAGSARVVFVNEGLRSGNFIFDPGDKTSLDDSSMIIIAGEQRYVREKVGFIRPEWFGADPGDTEDDAISIQKAMNTATNTGIELQFSAGVYLVGQTLRPKLIGNGAQYKISLTGKGKAITIIKGMPSLVGKNMFEFVPPAIKPRMPTYISVRDIEFQSVKADRILFANNISRFDLQDCNFFGGDTCGVQIGDKVKENYSVYLNRCYFSGGNSVNGHNLANLRLYARYPVVNQMVCDGGQYGIDLFADRAFIENCLFEGNKRAGIYMKTSGGGSHKIIGNDFILYGGFEASARYNGSMAGIYIESVAGGSSNSVIANNWIFMPAIADKVISATAVTGDFSPSPGTWIVKGQKSQATATLNGYDPTEKRMVFSMISGEFSPGETIIQDTKKGKAVVAALIPGVTYGIQLVGSAGYNIISGNQIRGSASTAIYTKSPGNIIEGNFIEGTNGVLVENDSKIINNTIYSPAGYAIKRSAGSVVAFGNTSTGAISNVTDLYLKATSGDSEVLKLTQQNNLILQNGGKFIDNGARLQVNGNSSFNGRVIAGSLPVYNDNAGATAAGLANGSIYRTPTGDLKVKF